MLRAHWLRLVVGFSLCSGLLRAGPADDALVAAVRLADAPNYAWSTAVADDARDYTVEGKTDRASDLSLVTMPMVASLRRRAGRGTSTSDGTMTAVYRGDEKLVIETPEGWKAPTELSSGRGGGGSRGGGMRGGMGGLRGGGMRTRSRNGGDRSGSTPAYSNLQLTLARPHDELAILVANYADLRVEEGVVSGTLSETGVRLLLVHPGQNEILPLTGSGTFRLWVRDGAVTKYEIKLEGKLAVTTNGNRREVEVHQKSTTTLLNVGATKLDVPDEARKKLGA